MYKEENTRVYAECISIRPNKIVVYNREFKESKEKIKTDTISKEESNRIRIALGLPILEPRNVNKHNFELSKQAQSNLHEKITWLYHLSKKQTVTVAKGKVVSDFRMSFVTLTLPSSQAHSSDFITKNCLNQFLVELSKKFELKHLVWRLEYQKNGNIHYHIATDIFINFFLMRNIWNRIINKYDYCNVYRTKMKSLSLMDYCRKYQNTEKTNFEVLRQRYAKGCLEDWQNPPSVDAKVCTNSKAVAFYISKYFGKNSSTGAEKILECNNDNSGNSRLWFCTRSLSKMKAISDIREAMKHDYMGMVAIASGTKKIICEYCTIFYYNMRDLKGESYRLFWSLFNDYALQQDYY